MIWDEKSFTIMFEEYSGFRVRAEAEVRIKSAVIRIDKVLMV